ncbi:putative transcriptional regulator [Tibeticola sediminis]|jgi:putative transcriptional regulator|uniref:UPF0301 protein EDC62_1517 n=1 Tax=Tibeticola sediminis TaxID=1917811 RepID=A0A3N4URP8_9BURK|nr:MULTISPECIES: YqgE/AlgH family protein [Tibeticola]MCI4441142.1 YqgE/AlgH family protein [Tibeticola sp.]RPE67637.1 putative transcriptional regulator [Tibeticola sediminis]
MPRDSTGTDLADHFLIAMPGLEDGAFARSVIYLCEHTEDGALGLVVNKPGSMDLGGLFDKVDLPLARSELSRQIVLQGGPLQMDRGFVLHEPLLDLEAGPQNALFSSTRRVSRDVALTTSRDVLEALACGGGPRRLCVALGCVGWEGGQLESELLENLWLTVEADPSLLFEVPIEQRYERAMALLGIDAGRLSGQAGHA